MDFSISPIMETQLGMFQPNIRTNVISITDGHIFFTKPTQLLVIGLKSLKFEK